MRINTILFDLDGTLVPMDSEKFTETYFKSLNSYIYGYLGDANFVKNMLTAVNKMYKDKDESTTLMQKFVKYFNEISAIKYDIFKRYVEDYYAKEFDRLSVHMEKDNLIKMIVGMIKEKGYKLILASTPLLPQKAMEVRLKWSGLDKKDFDFIAHIDNMHYIKPSLEFFKEILAVNDISQEECIMIGNDVDEDILPASQLGISTYYLDEHGVNKSGLKVECPSGSYIQLYDWVKALPSVKD